MSLRTTSIKRGRCWRGYCLIGDFVSSYAPLHPYLDAGLISAWHTPLAIVLFSVLVEMAILPVWLGAGRVFLPEGELRVAALLYLASPVSLQFVTIDGQDNVVIAVLLALSLLLVLRSRAFAAGLSFGASVAAIKFLPLLYAPAFLLLCAAPVAAGRGSSGCLRGGVWRISGGRCADPDATGGGGRSVVGGRSALFD